MTQKALALFLKNGDLPSAYVEAKVFIGSFKDKEKKSQAAYAAFQYLGNFAYEENKKDLKSKRNSEDVIRLTSFCIQEIKKTWKVSHLHFLQFLYNIVKYLLEQDAWTEAKGIFECVFGLKKGSDKWSKNESSIITKTVVIFSKLINSGEEKFFKNLSETNPESALFWWKYLLRLAELGKWEGFGALFSATSDFINKVNGFSPSETVRMSKTLFHDLTTCLGPLKKNTVLMSDQDWSRMICLLDTLVYLLKDSELVEFGEAFQGFLSALGKAGSSAGPLEVISGVFNLTEAEKIGETLSALDSSLSSFRNYSKTTYYFAALNLVSHYLSKIKNILGKKYLCKNTVKPYIETVLSVFLELCKNPVRRNLGGKVYLLSSVPAIIYLVSGRLEDPKSFLIDVTVLLRKIIKHLALIPEILESPSYLNVPIISLYNVTLAYKKNEVHNETSLMLRNVLQFLVKISPETLEQLNPQIYVRLFLKTFAISYGKIGHAEEAFVGLLVFAVTFKSFVSLAFNAWASLKDDESIEVDQELTVADIVTLHTDIFVNYWSLPVEKISLPHFLLHEINSYRKFKSLHHKPVFAAFREAVKHTNDKVLCAQILISTLEAATTDYELETDISRLELSLKNYIRMYAKQTDQEVEFRFLLGNLFYQKARFDIARLRKMADADIKRMELYPKTDLPVLQANEKDDLEEYSLPPQFSYLVTEAQKPILESLQKATDLWKLDEPVPEDLKEKLTPSLTFIRTTGYLYRLYRLKNKEAQVWHLLINLSTELNNSKGKILGTAGLLMCQKHVDEKIVARAQEALSSSSLDTYSYERQLLPVALARNAFSNHKLRESREILSSLNEDELRHNFFVVAQYRLLNCLLIEEEVKNGLAGPETNFTNMIGIELMENLMYIVSHKKWETFCELCVAQAIVLDASLYLGDYFLSRGNMRYAKCYTKEQMTLTQKLGLPLRATEFLLLLGKMDNEKVELEELDAKLRGLETILELEELPIEVAWDTLAPGSPQLGERVRAKPPSLSHSRICDCNLCQNVDYQIQSVKAIMLRARHLSRQNGPSALELLKLAEELLLKMKEEGLEESDACEMELSICLCRVKVMWNMGLKEEVLRVGADVLRRLEDLPVVQSRVRTELNEFCFALLSAQVVNCIQSTSVRPEDVPAPTEAISGIRTPEKEAFITVPMLPEEKNIQVSPVIVPIHRRLNFCSDEESPEKQDEPKFPAPAPKEKPARRRIAPTAEGTAGLSVNSLFPSMTPNMSSTKKQKNFQVFCDDDGAGRKSKSTSKKTTKGKSQKPTATTRKAVEAKVPVIVIDSSFSESSLTTDTVSEASNTATDTKRKALPKRPTRSRAKVEPKKLNFFEDSIDSDTTHPAVKQTNDAPARHTEPIILSSDKDSSDSEVVPETPPKLTKSSQKMLKFAREFEKLALSSNSAGDRMRDGGRSNAKKLTLSTKKKS